MVEHYFGKVTSLNELIAFTQLLQCVGYKGMYEEARRQWPQCSMALNWDYNEPWMTAAGNNLITYPAKPKPAYNAVRESCRQQMASAKVEKFDYVHGEIFATEELFILNDLPQFIEPLIVKATLTSDTRTYDLGIWHTQETPASTHQAQKTVFTITLNEPENTFLHLTLHVENHPAMDTTYVFLCKNKNSTKNVSIQSLYKKR